MLSAVKWFTWYESLGELARKTNAETIHPARAERLLQIVDDVMASLAELFKIDSKLLIKILLADIQILEKQTIYTTLKQVGQKSLRKLKMVTIRSSKKTTHILYLYRCHF